MATEVTQNQQKIVSVLLSSGKYQTEEAVLSEALELLHQRDQLRGLVQAGIEQLDAGNRVSAQDALATLRAGLPTQQ